MFRVTMAQSSENVQISPNIDNADRVVASFHGKDPSQFTVRALKVWLASQGASTRGNKAQLVERYATDSKSVSATECSIVGCQRVPFAVS